MYRHCSSPNLHESLIVSIVSLLISEASPLKPDELNKLNEPNKLYKLHDATFPPCSNEEFMLISI